MFVQSPLQPLPVLQEAIPIDPAAINGVPGEQLTLATDSTVTVTYLQEGAASHNSLGYYVLDPSGAFVDVGIVFADASSALFVPGSNVFDGTGTLVEGVSSFDIAGLTAGQQLGFFLVRQGATLNPELDPNDAYSFVTAAGAPATIADVGLQLLANDGTAVAPVVGDLFFTTDPTPGTPENELNASGQAQTLSGADAAGNLVIAFEDQNRVGDTDDDFNGLVIGVDTVDAQVVNSAPVTLPDGQEVTLQIATETTTDDDTADLSGVISLTGFLNSSFNIVFVNDASSSTGSTARDALGNPIDLNGDGFADSVFDADVAAFNLLAAQLTGNGLGAADLGIVSFGSGATLDATTTVGDAAGIAAVLAAPGSGGSTDYEAALQSAIGFFSAQPDVATATNVVYFLSDGQPNGGAFDDEFAALTDAAGIDALVNAFGAGTGARQEILDLVDNTGGSEVFTDLSQITAGLSGSSLDVGDVASIAITVNGVVQQVLDGSAVTETPTGLQFGPVQLTGLDPAAINTVDLGAVLTADDGSTFDLVLSTQIVGAAAPAATATDFLF